MKSYWESLRAKLTAKMKLEQIFEECKKHKEEIPKGFNKMVAIVNKKYSKITKEEYDQLKCFITETLWGGVICVVSISEHVIIFIVTRVACFLNCHYPYGGNCY